ncbi:exopolygalacturonase-like protein [Carex littledalei]|uniref:Exopolygalacturonase-like protein n=1 Tax=Carex littledalei TaxID=544730 RepID=A0A833VQ06_9POAL|nr:exopolygalacturonase-like protein [Carex littledalei]
MMLGSISRISIYNLVVAGGGVINGQGAKAWSKDCDNKPVDSKYFHVGIHQCQSITVERLKISAPGDSKNTDGVHISISNNITLNSLSIGTGHGISIGSLGKYKDEQNVAHVMVKNSTVTGTTNGLRIKTWGGSPPSEAFNIKFEDIFVRNVSNPIIIDQAYCPGNVCNNETSQVKISDVTFKNIHGTSNTPAAVQLQCSKAVPCKNINLNEINLQPLTSIVSSISSVCSNVLGTVLGFKNQIHASRNFTRGFPKINFFGVCVCVC